MINPCLVHPSTLPLPAQLYADPCQAQSFPCGPSYLGLIKRLMQYNRVR
jgi:hypothetical protein